MADAFAPTAEFSVASEQPLGGVENRAAETAIRGFASMFSRTSTGASSGPSPDPMKAEFLEQMGIIEAQRASGQGLKATLNERRLIANYVSAGGKLNDELKSIVEATTGRPFDYYGQTEQQRQYEAMTGTEEFRTAFIAAQANNPGSSEEELHGLALASVQEQSVAADTLARNAAGEKVNWENSLQPAYSVVIDAFQGGAIAGLLEITASGGTLTPDEVGNAKLQWDLVKGKITKPSHITDTQWQGIQSKITAMDDTFETMTKLASSEHAVDQLKSVLMSAATSGGDLTLKETIAVLAYLQDPAGIMTAAGSGINPAELLNDLMGRTESGLKRQQDARLASNISSGNTVPTDPSQPVVPDGNVVLGSLPEEFSGYSSMDNSEVVSNLKASTATISAITTQNINAGNGADQDLSEAYQMAGAAMMGAKGFLSAERINSVVGSPDTVNQKLDALAAVDPEGAIEARVMLRSGLQAQLNMLEANEAAIMDSTGLQWDPERKQYFIPSHKTQAKLAEKYYSGEMTDRGFYMDNNQPTTGPVGWFDLQDRRKAIDAANNGLSALALPQEQPTEVAPTPENLEGANLSALQVASEKLGWSETDGVDKLTDFLQNNGQNIDPTETAWCAAFVNATLNESGLNGTGFLNARSFLSWGEEVTEPVEGDVVVLERNGSTWQGHVGFFKGYDANGNIMILGGNQGDAVTIQSYPASRLLGFRRATGEPLPVDNADAQQAADALATVMSTNGDITTTNLGPMSPEMGSAPDAGETGLQTFETEGDFLQAVMDGKVMDGESVVVEGKQTTFEDAKPADRDVSEAVEELVVPDPETSPMGPDGEDKAQREGAKPEPKYKKLRDLPVATRDAVIQEVYAVGGNSDVKVFNNIDDVMDSIFSGEVVEGDVIVVGGRVQVLAYEDK